jgi:hypothetical protein
MPYAKSEDPEALPLPSNDQYQERDALASASDPVHPGSGAYGISQGVSSPGHRIRRFSQLHVRGSDRGLRAVSALKLLEDPCLRVSEDQRHIAKFFTHWTSRGRSTLISSSDIIDGRPSRQLKNLSSG